MKKNLYLWLILVLASCLRLIQLGNFPSSLYWEETALGYDAYSIWKTGKDFHGNTFPIIAFRSFGDYKASGYFYAAAPFVGVFGLNNWSVRLPSALAGIVGVYIVYLLGKKLFADEKSGLWSAFALAVMPWHIQFSRAAFEVNLATTEILLGIYLVLSSSKKQWRVLAAGLMFVVSTYTYHSARVLAPLIALLSIIYLKKNIFRSIWWLVTIGVCFGLMLPMLINIRNPVVAQRFAETSLFSTSPAVTETNALREADINSLLSRVIHHRYSYWAKEIGNGVLAQLAPRFLFLEGDGNLRHQTGYTALLYWWSVIPLITIIVVSKTKTEKYGLIFVIIWIMLAAIPPALTNLTPHTLRFLPAAPAFALCLGYGLSKFINRKQLILTIGLITVILIEMIGYQFDYYTAYQVRSSSSWQFGYQQLISFIKSRDNSEELVQVTRAYGRPSMYFLYYLGYDPSKIQFENSNLPSDQGELLAFDKFVFGPIDVSQKGLAVSEKPLDKGELIKLINFLDEKPAFYVYQL